MTLTDTQNLALAEIDQLDQALAQHFDGKLVVQTALTRSLVSFQANKARPVYRWYKYKEAFSAALVEYFLRQYKEILSDLTPPMQPGLFPGDAVAGKLVLRNGSSLKILPHLPADHHDVVLTSPPYCNRYDYTRTYALELALLGVDESGLRQLRQDMLSCTVENRAKDLLKLNPQWRAAIAAADEQELLQAILNYLNAQKAAGALNNDGIPRMVRGYFYEMACVIAECARVLKPGAPLVMVNDNVRYAGASISVDIILSALAEQLGFRVENILVLPNGKGNSSQQMGEHGREVLRKCVYVWRKI